MGANSSIRAYNEQLLKKISTEDSLYLDQGFWKNLFETVSPYLEIPDLSEIILNQKQNTLHICQMCFDYLETAWLQVEELSPNLIRSSENSLNFLTFIIPVTIEHQLDDFFWSHKMGAYRVLKASLGLYSSLFFGSSVQSLPSIQTFNTFTQKENSQICNKRREMILKLLLSCLSSNDPSFHLLLTRDIFITEEFLVSLLQSLLSKSQDLVFLSSKCLTHLLSSPSPHSPSSQSLDFIKDLLIQRKKQDSNLIQSFFYNLSDENINKVLNSIVQGSQTLQNTDKIDSIISLLSALFTLNDSYCKYTAVNKNISVISAILSSCNNLSIRSVTDKFSKVFYRLSHFREFSTSLTTLELNTLLEFIFKIILVGDYEFQDYYLSLLSVFCNISPFILELSSSNSHLVTLVLEYLTDKAWLLSKKSNNLNIFYLLQGINSLIQYQWEGCPYLSYYIVKKKESFYKIIRMQVDAPDEACLDDKDTDGEIEEESLPESEESDSEEKKVSDSSSEEVYSEREDRVIELERISEGLILGLNAGGPDEVVQRTSYLNTHVSAFEEEADRRNTVQHIEIVREEDWKPTPEWMLVWKSRLPVKSVFIVIKELFSMVMDLQEKGRKVEEIVEKIKKCTLVGALPRPHSICFV